LDFTDFREILRLKVVWQQAFADTSVEIWRGRLFDALERLEGLRRKVAHSRALVDTEIESLALDVATVREILARSV
jgi:hypothetical protein